MAIDPATVGRQARAGMGQWPATSRHYYDPNNPASYHEVTVATNPVSEISVLESGGLLDRSNINVMAMVADLSPIPMNRDRVDLKIKTGSPVYDSIDGEGTWQRFMVLRTPDFYDPILPHISFVLGSPADE